MTNSADATPVCVCVCGHESAVTGCCAVLPVYHNYFYSYYISEPAFCDRFPLLVRMILLQQTRKQIMLHALYNGVIILKNMYLLYILAS